MKKWIVPILALLILLATRLCAASLVRAQPRVAAQWQGESDFAFRHVCVYFDESTLTAADAQCAADTIAQRVSEYSDSVSGIVAYGCARGETQLSYAERFADAELYSVSDQFFLLHPFQSISGALQGFGSTENDIVLNEQAAWMLFGSSQCVGEYVVLEQTAYRVCAVVSEPTDGVSARAYAEVCRAYVPILSDERIHFSSAILPEVMSDFSINTLTSEFPGGIAVDETARYDFSTLWKEAAGFFFGPQSDTPHLPPWAFAAVQTQRLLCLLWFCALLAFVVFVPTVSYCIVRTISQVRSRAVM